jgi:tetratricopeptide (TPR) repeat protein
LTFRSAHPKSDNQHCQQSEQRRPVLGHADLIVQREGKLRLGRRMEAAAERDAAISVYSRALDLYPTSERCYEALLRARLARGDMAAALEDYRRYERILRSSLQSQPSPAIRALLKPHID